MRVRALARRRQGAFRDAMGELSFGAPSSPPALTSMHPNFLPRCGILLAALVSFSSLHAQTTVTVQCAADNTLYQTLTGDASNGAGASIFVGQNAFGSIRRAVLRFDVAAALPAGARVLTAQLNLNSVQTTVALPHPMTGHRLLQSWGEGTSVATGGGGGGGVATTNDATWLHRFWNTTLWTTPGGDFVATPSFTASMPPFGPFSSNLSRTAAEDVQGWLNAPATNFGWLLKTVNETLSSTAHRIDSRESLGLKPTLTVTYLLPGQNGFYGVGCPVGANNFSAAWVGAPIGGATVQISKSAGPAGSVGADFFTLSLDPVGLTLLPSCSVWLPLAEVIPGGAFFTDGAGAGSSSFQIPVGFPGYMINCQAAVLTNNALGFAMSNSALTVLQ